jgi:hypothetical protein
MMFCGEVIFIDREGASGIDLALVAQREFRAAGFQTNITGDVDPYSNAAWLIVARQSDVDLSDEVESIAKQFGGGFDERQLIDRLDAFWRDRLFNSESEHE